MKEAKTHIVENRQVAPNTFRMELACPEVAGRARPGQFVMVRTTAELSPLLRRPLSVHDVTGRGNLRLLYRIVGKGTALLSEMREGAPVSLLGPLGRGFSPEAAEAHCLVAGGIGVAPLLFLARELIGRNRGRVRLLLGGRSSADILCVPDFEALGVRVDAATEDGSLGRRGMVTDLLEELLEKGEAGAVYACGPEAMLKVVAVMARGRKSPCQVSLESHMACGLGVCLGCAREKPGGGYYHVCKDGPVMDAERLWPRPNAAACAS
ncbi:MAG: dihydroorotate dehydrogenase electron transfer subunit [Thermodesulfobacteriota bacterium]